MGHRPDPVIDLADAGADAWIIEDDDDSEDRLMYRGTFSKLCHPARGVGHLTLPRTVVAAFRAVRESIDLCPPVLHQRALADFMREGRFGASHPPDARLVRGAPRALDLRRRTPLW